MFELYGQDAELLLLGKLLEHLDHRTMIDVGAERGSLAAKMLRAGVEELHAFDPHPGNANALRTRFAGDRRLTVHEHAVSDADGHGELHLSSNPDGTPLPFGHTLLERADTDEIAWTSLLPVGRRSLHSLMDGGEIPASVGILKIDTEGHDLAVVRGMGELQADVVMVEHWTDLPHGLGLCPWTAEEMVALLQARDFTHFAFMVHRGEFVTLKWDDADVERGAMGNLLFLHDRVLGRLLPVMLDCAGRLAEQAVRQGQTYMHAAAERLALVNDLKQAADDRLALVDELEQTANDRLDLVNTLSALAEERLRALAVATAELEAAEVELALLRQQTS
jgi:FkbM family methyltransferase